MKYCRNCGAIIEDNTERCPECGVRQSDLQNKSINSGQDNQQNYSYGENSSYNPQFNQNQGYNPRPDNGGFGWGLLGFCIPVVGLVLFLVWKDEKPKTGKAAGLGALISVCISAAFYILSAIIGITAGLVL